MRTIVGCVTPIFTIFLLANASEGYKQSTNPFKKLKPIIDESLINSQQQLDVLLLKLEESQAQAQIRNKDLREQMVSYFEEVKSLQNDDKNCQNQFTYDILPLVRKVLTLTSPDLRSNECISEAEKARAHALRAVKAARLLMRNDEFGTNLVKNALVGVALAKHAVIEAVVALERCSREQFHNLSGLLDIEVFRYSSPCMKP